MVRILTSDPCSARAQLVRVCESESEESKARGRDGRAASREVVSVFESSASDSHRPSADTAELRCAAFDDFGGGASVEYLRKEERKDCLGNRAEMRGTRRAEVRKERVMGFMMMVVVAGKRGGMGNRLI